MGSNNLKYTTIRLMIHETFNFRVFLHQTTTDPVNGFDPVFVPDPVNRVQFCKNPILVLDSVSVLGRCFIFFSYYRQIGPSSYLSRDLGELTDSGGVEVPDLGQHVVVGEADVQLLLLLHHFPLHKLILVILVFGEKSRRKSMKLPK